MRILVDGLRRAGGRMWDVWVVRKGKHPPLLCARCPCGEAPCFLYPPPQLKMRG